MKPKLKPCPSCESVRLEQAGDFVVCNNCGLWGPEQDPNGHKWNSIPRRSEVLDLLKKLEWAMLASDWNRADELEELKRYADKLREEMKGE